MNRLRAGILSVAVLLLVSAVMADESPLKDSIRKAEKHSEQLLVREVRNDLAKAFLERTYSASSNFTWTAETARKGHEKAADALLPLIEEKTAELFAKQESLSPAEIISAMKKSGIIFPTTEFRLWLREEKSQLPITGAKVKLRPGSTTWLKEGNNGLYIIDGVSPGSYKLVVDASGYARSGQTDTKSEGTITSDLKIRSTRKGRFEQKVMDLKALKSDLTVMVTDDSGKPIQGAKVMLGDNLFQMTGKDGIYTFKNIATGSYKIEASAHGFKVSAQKTVKHSPENSKDHPVRFALDSRSSSVAVRTLDHGGIAIPAATVTFGGVTNFSNAKGMCFFTNMYLIKGESLAVTKPGFTAVRERVTLPARSWSDTTYKEVVMRRVKQFTIKGSLNIEDRKDVLSNNGNGKANAGELIKIPVTVRNVYSEESAGWRLLPESKSPGLGFRSKDIYSFGPLKPGEEKKVMVTAVVSPSLVKFEAASFIVNVAPSNDALGTVSSKLALPLYPGKPLKLRLMDDPPKLIESIKGDLALQNNGSGKLGPGEKVRLKLAIANLGKENIKNVKFFLRPSIDPLPGGGRIHELKNEEFKVFKKRTLISKEYDIELMRNYTGKTLPLTLMAISYGRSWTKSFTIPIEKREHFHATMALLSKPERGAICNFLLKIKYTGNSEAIRSNIKLVLPKGFITKPSRFNGRIIKYGDTLELKGIIAVPLNYKHKAFPMQIRVHDMDKEQLLLFEKKVGFPLAK